MFVNGKSVIRTRLSIAPIGHLHLGAARTALINYLFAKRYEGSFILRTEDVDYSRPEESIVPILDSLRWLGIIWDDGPIYQKEKRKHYVNIAQALIKLGKAYPDLNMPQTRDKPYRGQNRSLSPERAMELYDDAAGWCVRYKLDNSTVYLDDLIKGQVKINTNDLHDPVILKPGDVPTAIFTGTIDDAEMKITHVIRTEEHLDNTAIQILIMNDIGYVPPFYAHLPLIQSNLFHEKLSKRGAHKLISIEDLHKLRSIGFSLEEIRTRDELNPTMVTFYNALGYQPQAIIDYLATISDDDYLPSDKPLKDQLNLATLAKPADYNAKDVLLVASELTEKDTVDDLVRNCADYLIQAKLCEQIDNDHLAKIIIVCKDKIKVYSDILTYAPIFLKEPIYTKANIDKHMKDLYSIDVFVNKLKYLSEWNAELIENALNDFSLLFCMPIGKLVYALSAAVCGKVLGLNIFKTMELLGQEKSIARLRTALDTFGYINHSDTALLDADD